MMAYSIPWKLLVPLLISASWTVQGSIHHSMTQIHNSTRHEIYPMISKQAVSYKMYLIASVILGAARNKPLTNKAMILNINLFAFDDTDDVVYYSNDHHNQTTENVIKIKYVEEFKPKNTPYIQRDNRAHSKSITLDYFSQSFQRSVANAYLKNIYAHHYKLFSQKNLNADSFEKAGLKLKQTDSAELNDTGIDSLEYYSVIPVKHFQLEIVNRGIFLNSHLGKKLMQPPVVIQIASALRAANTINNHPKILNLSNKRYVDILAHEILQVIKNNETNFEAKLSTRFLNGDSSLSTYAMAIRDNLFPGMNIGQIEPGSNVLIDNAFLVSHLIATECGKNYGKLLPILATDANLKALLPIQPETIIQFMENLTLSIYVTSLDDVQHLCTTMITEIMPDFYRPFLLQYVLQYLFNEMKSSSKVHAANIKNYLIDNHRSLSTLVRKPSSGNNLIFCVGDSSSLEQYLDFTGQSNPHDLIPVALFNTWNMTYACDQVLQLLDQSHAPDLYFILLVDIPLWSQFLEAALTMPAVGLPRTICLLISHSDSVTLEMKPKLQEELKVMEKLLEQKNYANARIIFIIEEPTDLDSPSQMLLTMLNATIFAGASKSRYFIKDGPYNLKKTSLNAALNISIQLNGQTITVRELFSPISPESQELSLGKHIWFQIGKKDFIITEAIPAPATSIPGGVYIDRRLAPWPNSKVMPLAITTDTPTAIANDIAICLTSSSETKIIAINGESGSGKTVILKKIQYELQSMSPSTWSIFIDLPQLLPPRRSEETVTVEKIVHEVVDSNFRDLFWKLVKINPRKILFLLDGVDELKSDQEMSILNIIVNLFELGVHVVLTGNFRTVELLLNKPSLTIVIYDICKLSFRDTRELLSCIWHEQFKNETLNISGSLNSYFIDYVDDFSAELFHLVRYTITPLALVMIAEIFRKHCLNHIQEKFVEFDLQSHNFNEIDEKTNLYEKYIATISESIHNIQNFQQVYSTHAFMQIFESVDNLRRESPLLRPVHNEIVDAELQYKASIFLDASRASTSRNHVHRNVNHKDIKEFFATKYIEKLLSRSGINSPIYLLESLVKNPAYSNLMSYLDSTIDDITEKPTLFETSAFSSNDRRVELRMVLKHLINIRCATLHNFIFHTLTSERQVELRDFYITEEIEFYKPMQTFGQLSLREYAQLDILEMQPTKIRCTLMCKLVENSMLTSLELFRRLNIWYDSNSPEHTEYYNNMLDIAVTRPTPNQFVLEFLLENTPTPEFIPDLNSLLLRTVSETGDGCQPIANVLIKLGANPQLAKTPDGRSLLHAAVKWQNLDLLVYVVEELKVNKETATATNSELSVFAAALDANPCPFYTPPNWWRMMDYLVHNVAGVTEQRMIDQPSTSRVEPASVRLFKAISVNLYSSNFNIFSSHAILNILSDHEFERLIRYATWNMHPQTLAFRRRIQTNKILAEYDLTQVSPLELILYYQGMESLPTHDRIYYEKTVFNLLVNVFKASDNKPRTQLIKMVITNVYNADDLDSLKLFVNTEIAFTPEESEMMVSLLDQHLASTSRTMSNPGIQSFTSLLSTMNFILRNHAISPMILNAHNRVQYSSLMHKLLESAPTSTSHISLTTDTPITAIERCLTQPSSSCGISWESIDEFNDASDRRSIRQIRINSERFLVVLARTQNSGRSQSLHQLLEFGRNVLNLPQGIRFITGNARMVLREILHHPNFNSYSSSLITSRVTNDIFTQMSTTVLSEAQRNLTMSISNYGADADRTHSVSNSEPVSTPKKSSYSTVANALSIVMFIRHLHAAVAMCAAALSNNEDTKECIVSSSSLAKFTLVDFIGPKLVAYMPLILVYYSHSLVHYLPANMRHFFLDCFRSNGLCSQIRTRKLIRYGLGTVGALFDIYIIADSAKSLLQCITKTSLCTSKTMFDLITALGFSSMSLGVSVASMIIKGGQLTYPLLALSLLLLESIVLTGNTVLWYSSNYHTSFLENVRICLYSLLFIGIPSDILELEARTDRINDLQKQVVKFLKESDSQIVAYATGVGRLSNSVWAPGESTINMLTSDIKNTHRLSRVLPGSIAGMIPLCLPKKDSSESYETPASQTVASSVYACENALVIADTKKWRSITRDSIMIYDLLHVNRGYIVGSNIVNNYFMIWKGQETFHIVAHSNEVSNVFLFQDSQFHGRISLVGAPNYQTIFDMSNLQDIITVTWKSFDRKASVQIGRELHKQFTITKPDSDYPHFLFNGRPNRKDIYNCDYHSNYAGRNIHDRSITVNGAGGNELLAQYDDITDCQTTVVQPWTIIRGSSASATVYTSYVYLDHPPTTNQSLSDVHILPKKSQFFIVFSGSQFILAKTINVTYSATNDTLIWHFWHTNSTQMKLYVKSVQPVNKTANNTTNGMFSNSQAAFSDHHTNATVYPVIKLPISNFNVILVQRFYLVVSILTTKFVDIYSYYNQRFSSKTSVGNFSFDINFIHEVTKENFIFGSKHSGRYLIEASTTLVAGNGGKDIYVYSNISPQTVYIDNYSSDRITDTLIIVNNTCGALTSVDPMQSLHSMNDLGNYLLLRCSDSLLQPSFAKYIVVLKYFDRMEWRHLQILWNDKVFVPLPPNWSGGKSMILDPPSFFVIPKIALYFSFDDDWNEASLTATYRDAFIMVKEGSRTNPLVFYRIGHDVVITKKYFHNAPVVSLIILKEFFAESSSERISPSYDYHNFRLILIDDQNDNVNDKVWNTTDVFLQLNTEIKSQRNSADDFIHNNLINMTKWSPKHTELYIGGDNSSINFFNNSIEVLTFVGVKPMEFQIGIYMYDKSYSSMVFCAKHYSLVVKNWCGSANNRPKYIAFLTSYYMEPVMIKHLDKLDCSKVDKRIVIVRLEDMFLRAQKRMDLIEKIGFNDTSRAMKCLGIVFAEHIDRENIYRIFGFSSLIEQHQYMVGNCNELLSKDYIDSVTHEEMYGMLNDTIKLFEFSDDIPLRHEQIIMSTILTEFKRFHQLCWIQFKNSFYANHQVTFTIFDVKNILRWQRFRDSLFTLCSRYSENNNQTILLDSIINSRDFHNTHN